MKKKILTIAFAVLIPVMTAQAEGNANTTILQLNSMVDTAVFEQPNLSQPSRRDVAGAVLLDMGPNEPAHTLHTGLTRTVDENGAQLNTE